MKPIFSCILIAILLSCGSTEKIPKKTEETTLGNTRITEKNTEELDVTGSVKEKKGETKKTDSVPEVETPVSKIHKEIAKSAQDTLPKTTVFFDHNLWSNLLQRHVTKEGRVNYPGFKKDRAVLKNYLTLLSENMPDETWSRHDKLAYWMNAYNAFTIKLIIDNYPVKSIKDIKDPWEARFFKLGTKWFNLNEIEHRILRKMGDPRVHFGINCASFSCPPLLNKAFTDQNVDEELEELAIRFINDPSRNNITSHSIRISKIFNWFSKDFKTKGSLIDYLNKYTKVKIQKEATKRFMEYNWSLNE